MSGIRTNAAAKLLGVSPNTLRSWERRFGYPQPRRTAGGHRQYELPELEALRRALRETHNISSAVEVARQRGRGPSSPDRLLDAFDAFAERSADAVMEESLAVRSVDRSVEQVLLPAMGLAEAREGREAEWELAARWASGWLHAQLRICPEPTREEFLLVLDASRPASREALHVLALELALRRVGFPTLALPADLSHDRLGRAARAVTPSIVVLACADSTPDQLARLRYAMRDSTVYEYESSLPVTAAVAAVKEMLDAAVRLPA